MGLSQHQLRHGDDLTILATIEEKMITNLRFVV